MDVLLFKTTPTTLKKLQNITVNCKPVYSYSCILNHGKTTLSMTLFNNSVNEIEYRPNCRSLLVSYINYCFHNFLHLYVRNRK